VAGLELKGDPGVRERCFCTRGDCCPTKEEGEKERRKADLMGLNMLDPFDFPSRDFFEDGGEGDVRGTGCGGRSNWNTD